jgi:hypothetical protein
MPADSGSGARQSATETFGMGFNPSVLRRASWRSGVLCGLLVVAVVLACNPTGETGYQDDWTFARTAAIFAQTGHFVYNGWAAPTLGWFILWAAPFIKIFGFSYLILRLSLLPIVFATILLFHQILLRFGLTEWHASFGVLTLGLSPIFLPVASGFMTDVPSLLVTFTCLLICQIAVAQKHDQSVVVWLAVAALTNLLGGTVRQTAFLGILLMIPAVGWWQRKRRGVLLATAIITAIGCVCVYLFFKWYLTQPYSYPESIPSASILWPALKDRLWQVFAASRFALVAISPVIACNIPTLLRLPRAAFWGIYACFSLFVLLTWSEWDRSQLGIALKSLGISVPVAFVSALLAFALLFLVLRRRSGQQDESRAASPPLHQSQSCSATLWLLGPFSLGYFVLLLVPTDGSLWVWDRYFLGLIPIAIVCLLKVCQDRASGIPKVAIVALVLLGFAGFAKASRLHSVRRAVLKAANMLRAANVPRTEIEAGLEYDGDTQLDAVGHVNNPDMTAPPGVYRLYVPPRWLPPGFDNLAVTPAVVPRYFVVEKPLPDLAPSKFPPVEYTTVIPPFHRFIYIQQLPER